MSSTLAAKKRTLPVTEIADVDLSVKKYIQDNYRYQAILIMLGTIVLSAIFGKLTNFSGVTLVPFLVPILLYVKLRNKVQTAFMQQFAAAKNFGFNPKGSFEQEIGEVFKRGYSRSLYNEVLGRYKNYPLRLFNYSFLTGSGKQTETHCYTVFDLEFTMDMPRIYLDELVTPGVSDILINDLVRLPLSSVEFERFFKLYITPGSQITALQIFTPDLMAELLDWPVKFNVEIVGRQIYIYAAYEVSKTAELNAMYKLAEMLITNMGQTAEKIRP